MLGPLKLKKVSDIHAEGYASGEMKHGPIALIDEALLISKAEGIAEAGEGCMATIEMPSVHPLIAPLVYSVPVQLHAYHVACAKRTDVDQPRNLAKSVTVD